MSVASLIGERGTAFTLKRRTTITQDTSGGATGSFAAVGASTTGVPGWLQTASSNVQKRYEQRGLFVSHVAYFGQDMAAKAMDILVSGTRTFIVQGNRDASAGLGELFAVDCLEQGP